MPVPRSRSFLAAIPAVVLAALVVAGCTVESRTAYANGSPKQVGQLVNGQQSGEWTYYFENGRKQANGGWKADRQDGAWSWWYEDGTPKQAGSYDASLRTGTWSYWYPNGHLYCRGDYDQDHQTGLWVYYHPGGKLAAVGAFDHGAKALGWRWWREDGSPQEQGAYWDGRKVGPWTTWGVDGVAKTTDQGCPPGTDCYREPATGEPLKRWGAVSPDEQRSLWLAFDAKGSLDAMSLTIRGVERFVAFAADGSPAGSFTGDPRKDDVAAWTRWDATGGVMPTGAPGADLLVARQKAMHEPLAQTAPVKSVEAKPDLSLPEKGHVALTPMAILPVSYWTKREEANAALLIEKYTTGRWPQSGAAGYGNEEVASHGSDRPDLKGKPLAITRLLSSSGDVIDLKDYQTKGKNVVLVVLRGFAGQVCVYCATQTAALAKSLERFRAANTEVVLVYPGAVESVPVFLDAVATLGADQPKIPIALDVDLQLVKSLEISHHLAKPTSLIIDKQGLVRYAYVGETRADRPSVDDLLRQIRKLDPPQ